MVESQAEVFVEISLSSSGRFSSCRGSSSTPSRRARVARKRASTSHSFHLSSSAECFRLASDESKESCIVSAVIPRTFCGTTELQRLSTEGSFPIFEVLSVTRRDSPRANYGQGEVFRSPSLKRQNEAYETIWRRSHETLRLSLTRAWLDAPSPTGFAAIRLCVPPWSPWRQFTERSEWRIPN